MTVSTTTYLTQAEEVVTRLPPTARIFLSLRDFTLVDITLPNLPLAQRTACVWDPDRDIRTLLVLGTFVLLNRSLCADLVGLAETRGTLRSFWVQPHSYSGGFASANFNERLQAAANVALEGQDHWIVAPPEFVTLDSNGQLDVSTLPADHPLRVVPHRFQLGRVPR